MPTMIIIYSLSPVEALVSFDDDDDDDDDERGVVLF